MRLTICLEFRYQFYSRATLQKGFNIGIRFNIHVWNMFLLFSLMVLQKMHLHSVLLLIKRWHQCSQSWNHGFPNFNFNNYVWRGCNIGIRFNLHVCNTFCCFAYWPAKKCIYIAFSFWSNVRTYALNLGTTGSQFEELWFPRTTSSQFKEQALPTCVSNDSESWNLGVPSSRNYRFPNLRTNASQSWNLGFPVLGTSGSQTWEPMLPFEK